MAIYIYRRAASDSARALAAALNGKKVQRLPKLIRQDLVICWGSQLDGVPCKVLNGAVLKSKITDVEILAAAKVPTIDISSTRKDGWLPRTLNHTGGLDLLTPPERPDFWVKKEEFIHEFRVHSFRGVSIRAGIKSPRSGFRDPHPWIRSWDGGWCLRYDGKSIKQRHRDVAHAAIAALGLDFGAVDIGQRKDKTLVVLEVNRAPGITGGTVKAYADAIQRWRKG